MSPFGFGIFSLMNSIFPIAFLAILILILFTIGKGLKQWLHNNGQPQIPAEALIVAKRARSTHHHNGHHHGHQHGSSSYYVTFQFRSGDRAEIQVPPREFGLLAKGDEGVLTLQGTRFIHFDRRFSSADPYCNDTYYHPSESADDERYRTGQGSGQ